MQKKIENIQKFLNQSNFKEALILVNKLLKKDKKNPFLFNIKGVILFQDGQTNNAIEAYSSAIKFAPDFFDAFNNLGMAYQKKKYYDKAIVFLKKAISLKEDYIEARHNLAIVYDNMDEPYEAIEELKLLLQYNPKHSTSLRLLGDIYNRVNNIQEALRFHEQSLKSELSHKNLYKLGMDYFYLGNKDKAMDCLRVTLPYHMESFYALATYSDYEFSKLDLDFLAKTFMEDKDANQRAVAGFSLAKILKKKKEYEKSFEVLVKANELRSMLIGPFDQESFLKNIKKIEECYLSLKELKLDFMLSDLNPIFILGSPRSGTTIIEQIISNHPDIYGAGEVNKLHRLMDDMILNKNISKDTLEKLRQSYYSFIKKMTTKKYFIDKTPFNSFYLGLIKRIFPESITINTHRDFKSVAFSMYENNFDALNFTFRQEDIIFYLKNYKKNIEFWGNQKFANHMVIDLEKFIKDKDIEMKKFFSLLNLDFKKEYLNHTKNEHPVYTASAGQVRSKNVPQFSFTVKNYGKIIDQFNSLISEI